MTFRNHIHHTQLVFINLVLELCYATKYVHMYICHMLSREKTSDSPKQKRGSDTTPSKKSPRRSHQDTTVTSPKRLKFT